MLERSDDPKLYINQLIELLDKVFSYLGVENVGTIKRDYSQKILCVTNERSIAVSYESSIDHTHKRVLLSGEGLELLSRVELEQLLRLLEEPPLEPRADHLRRVIMERINKENHT